jgi:GNAT superfamily N-acetyltransferase
MSGQDVPGLRVRRVVPQDAPELARLRWEHCMELWEPPPAAEPMDRDAFRVAFGRFLERTDRDDRWVGWVAEEDAQPGRVVGTLALCQVTMLPTPWEATRAWGYVTSIQVDPDRRGRGVGRALMDEAVAWARAHGFEQLLLWAAGESPAFYEAVGFHRPPIVMELPLM